MKVIWYRAVNAYEVIRGLWGGAGDTRSLWTCVLAYFGLVLVVPCSIRDG